MTRLRSPNFPGISLEQAVSLAGAIFKQNRQNLITRETAAKDLGYTGLTGRSLKLLGAMNQYNLIENKAGGNMRVTDTAREILHGIEPKDRLEALRAAGRAPSLFKAIFDRFPDGVPSENAVRSFMVQSGFTDRGVDTALKSFMDTNRYLESEVVSENCDDSSEIEHVPSQTQNGPSEQALFRPILNRIVAPVPRQLDAGVTRDQNAESLDFSLSSSGLAVAGKTNSASALLAFIKKLQALAVLLPDEEEESGERKAQ